MGLFCPNIRTCPPPFNDFAELTDYSNTFTWVLVYETRLQGNVKKAKVLVKICVCRKLLLHVITLHHDHHHYHHGVYMENAPLPQGCMTISLTAKPAKHEFATPRLVLGLLSRQVHKLMQLVPTDSGGVKKSGAARDGAASSVLTMAMGKVCRVLFGGDVLFTV